MKVVTENMKILGGEDEKPGLPLVRVSFSSQFRPGCSQKRGLCLTEGCGPTQHRG
jgi:hypothetical protein